MTKSAFNLTAAQARFAEQHSAVPVMECDRRSTIFYRQNEFWAHRWIVDDGGRVLDEAQFRHHPPKEAVARDAVPLIRASDHQLPV